MPPSYKNRLLMRLPYFLSLPIAATLSILTVQQGDAQQVLDQSHDEIKIGGATVAKILKRLGAKMEHGVPSDVMSGYSRHFGLVDSDGDGRHSTVEYVDNSNYMTPQARRGIFKAADHDKDGFVSKAEYVINRIITDEGKAIVQAMDDDKDGVVQRAEFIKHANVKFSDAELTGKVFAALDADSNKEIVVPEYLRIWGQWARAGGQSAEERFATANKEQVATKENSGEKRNAGGRGGPPEGRPGGPPDRGRGGFGPFSGNGEPVRLNRAGLKVGSSLPDLSIFDANGKAFKTSSLKGKYAVLVFGCLT